MASHIYHISKKYDSAKREIEDLRKKLSEQKELRDENKALKKENRRLRAILENLKEDMIVYEPCSEGIDLSGLFISIN